MEVQENDKAERDPHEVDFYEELRRLVAEEGLSREAAAMEMGVDHDG